MSLFARKLVWHCSPTNELGLERKTEEQKIHFAGTVISSCFGLKSGFSAVDPRSEWKIPDLPQEDQTRRIRLTTQTTGSDWACLRGTVKPCY